MLFEALALVTSLTSALGSVLAARGMKGSSPLKAAFYSVLTQALILTGMLLARPSGFDPYAVLLFAAAGILSLGAGRLLNFAAMKEIGVSKTSALVGSSPVMTALIAPFLISEPLTTSTVLGAALVTGGIVLISGARNFRVEKAVAVGLLSSLSYALSNIVSKMGLRVTADPLISAQVGAVAGFCFIAAYLASRGELGGAVADRSGLRFFVATGVLSSLGWLTLMEALRIGVVSVATTIVYSYPLFTLVISRLIMKGDEKITSGMVAGSVLVVAGIAAAVLLKL